ncbi:hypothetical protein ACLBPJ_26490, partial [Klebsiella pneumoniae]
MKKQTLLLSALALSIGLSLSVLPPAAASLPTQVPGQGALSLSLGMQRMFADEECGMLGLLSSWVLALMQQHWQ